MIDSITVLRAILKLPGTHVHGDWGVKAEEILADALEQARHFEREACARLVLERRDEFEWEHKIKASQQIATAIRGRNAPSA